MTRHDGFRSLGLVLLCLTLSGLRPDDSVELRPHWKVGDVVEFEVAQAIQTFRGGALDEKCAYLSALRLEVVKATEEGYVIQSTIVPETQGRSELPPGFGPPIEDMHKLLADTKILVKVHPDGVPLGLQNLSEIQECMRKQHRKWTEDVMGEDMDDEILKKMEDRAMAILGTKEVLSQLFAPDVDLLLAPLGKTYEEGSTVDHEAEVEGKLWEEPFQITERFSLKSLDRLAGHVVVDSKGSVTGEEIQRVRKVRAEAIEGGRVPPSDMPSDSVSMEAKGEFVVDIATGWIESLKRKVTTVDGDGSEVRTTMIRRKTREKE